jgi:hypothetical protein
VQGTDGRSVETQESTALEDAVDDGLAKSSSWSTRPHAFSDLFVVKTIGAAADGAAR